MPKNTKNVAPLGFDRFIQVDLPDEVGSALPKHDGGIYMENYGKFWDIMWNCGILWEILGNSGISDYNEWDIIWYIFDHSDYSGTINGAQQ